MIFCLAQFKTFSERIEEVDIDVYRSLDTLKAEPSEGSSFFRDCLMENRVSSFSIFSLDVFSGPFHNFFLFFWSLKYCMEARFDPC